MPLLFAPPGEADTDWRWTLLDMLLEQEDRWMTDMYPHPTHEISALRRQLSPSASAAFAEFSKAVFADGALSTKMKQLIAVAVAHVTQCPYCIRGHTEGALGQGATREEIMEAIWVAAEMRAGGAFAHSTIALTAMREAEDHQKSDQ